MTIRYSSRPEFLGSPQTTPLPSGDQDHTVRTANGDDQLFSAINVHISHGQLGRSKIGDALSPVCPAERGGGGKTVRGGIPGKHLEPGRRITIRKHIIMDEQYQIGQAVPVQVGQDSVNYLGRHIWIKGVLPHDGKCCISCIFIIIRP
ncbi:hypothetical protein ES708_13367 [subsurface metagenome]